MKTIRFAIFPLPHNAEFPFMARTEDRDHWAYGQTADAAIEGLRISMAKEFPGEDIALVRIIQ